MSQEPKSVIVSKRISLIDAIVKFLSGTGRDRVNRFVQYFSRFLIWYGQSHGYQTETIDRLQALMSSASQTRKMMRIGRQLEFYRNFVKAADIKDDISRILTMSKNLGMGMWLVHDLFSWAHAAKVAKFDNVKDISQRGNKFWLFALVASFLNNLHKLYWNKVKLDQEKRITDAVKAKKLPVEELSVSTVKSLRSERATLVQATIQDSLDILIPASSLEYIHLESGYIGLAGTITSLMGAYTAWKAVV